jgi:tRNA uridine 5-carbamoylmethylation protein Kti12
VSITINPNRKRRPLLIVTRGLPCSGKTPAAVAWVRSDETWRTRVNRNDLRDMAHGRRTGTGAQEAIVSGQEDYAVRSALANGTSVVVDDTNLVNSVINRWAKIAEEMDADFEVWDFRDVDPEVCIARDAQRPAAEQVGEDKIREMHEKHIVNSGARHTVPVRTRSMAHG